MGMPRRNETSYLRPSELEPSTPFKAGPEEKILHYTRVIHNFPGQEEGYYQRGRALYLKGDLAASLADFRQTLKINPGHKGALIGQAMIEARVERPKRKRNRCTAIRALPTLN